MEPSIIRDSNADDIDDWIDGDLDFETAWERYMGDVQKEAQHSTAPSPQIEASTVSSSVSDKQQQFKPVSPKPANTNEGLLNFEESNAFSQFLDSLIQKPSSPQQDSYGKIDQELQKLHELLGLSPPQHQPQADLRQLNVQSQGEPHQQGQQQERQEQREQQEQRDQRDQREQQLHHQQQQLQHLQPQQLQQLQQQPQHQQLQQQQHQQQLQHSQLQQQLHQQEQQEQPDLRQQGPQQGHQQVPQEPKLQNHSLYKQPQVFSRYQEPYSQAYSETLPSHMHSNQSQVLQSAQQLPMYPYDYGSYAPSSMTSHSAPPKSVSPLGAPLLPVPPLSAPPMSMSIPAQSSAPMPAPMSAPMSASKPLQPMSRSLHSAQPQSRLQTAPEDQVEVPWRARQPNKVNVRIKHVNSEKKRRALISDLYSQMCELLPVEIRELLPKSVVLKNTYRHMKMLEANNASLREKLVQNGVNCDNIASVLLDKVPHSLLEHWDLEDDRK